MTIRKYKQLRARRDDLQRQMNDLEHELWDNLIMERMKIPLPGEWEWKADVGADFSVAVNNLGARKIELWYSTVDECLHIKDERLPIESVTDIRAVQAVYQAALLTGEVL